MPYLKITAPPSSANDQIAEKLTSEILTLFYNPRSGISEREFTERITVHFIPYKDNELFIGGKKMSERSQEDVTLEISDWNMSVKKQRKVAKHLTPVLAALYNISPQRIENVNIRFHSYPPTDFSVGGRLLSDIVPWIGRVMKKIGG